MNADRIRFRVTLGEDGRLRATKEGDEQVVVTANDLGELRGKLELMSGHEGGGRGPRVSLMFRVSPDGNA